MYKKVHNKRLQPSFMLGLLFLFLFNSSLGNSRGVSFSVVDTSVYKGDSIVLILNEYRGEIQWEKSNDGLNWTSIIDVNSDTLSFIADTTTNFRVKVTEGTCVPVYSDTINVIVNTIPIKNTVIISPDGGEYFFPNGIIINVPAGAVTEDIEIEITIIEKTNDALLSILDTRGVIIDNLYVCFEAKPDGLTFNEPISLIFPVNLQEGEFVFTHEIDLINLDFSLTNSKVLCNPEDGTIELSLNHFSTYTAEQIEELRRGQEYCEQNPCKCGKYTIEQSDLSQICGVEECQLSESKLKVHYFACDLIEEYYARELSVGCVPKLSLNIVSDTVSTEGQTDIIANLALACSPLNNQTVDFSVSGLGILYPESDKTNSEGRTKTTFKASNDEGLAIITVIATIKYATLYIYASAEGMEEDTLISSIKELRVTDSIFVKKYPAKTVIITPSEVTLEVNDNYPLTVEVIDSNGTYVYDRSVQWYSSNVDVTTTDPLIGYYTTVTGHSEGIANITANCENIIDSVKISVIPSGNEIELTIKDATSWTPENTILDPIEGATVDLYASQNAFDAGTPDYTTTSDENGKAIFYDMPASTYFLLVQKGELSNITASGFLIIGVFQSVADIDISPLHPCCPKPGSLRLKDINADFIINSLDHTEYDIITLIKGELFTRDIVIGKE